MTFKDFTQRFDAEIQQLINEQETKRLQREKEKEEKPKQEKRLPKMLATAALVLLMFLGSSLAFSETVGMKFLDTQGQPITTLQMVWSENGTPLTTAYNPTTHEYEANANLLTNGFLLTVTVGTVGQSANDHWSFKIDGTGTVWNGIDPLDPKLIQPYGPPDQTGAWQHHIVYLRGPDPYVSPVKPTLEFVENVAPYNAGSPTQKYSFATGFDNMVVPIKFSDPWCSTDKVGGLKLKVAFDNNNAICTGLDLNAAQPVPATIQYDALGNHSLTINILWNQNTQLDYTQPLFYLKFSTNVFGKITLSISDGENRQYSTDNLYWIATTIVSNNATISLSPGDFNNDGYIDVADLGLLATHYWAGVPGYVGTHVYDAKYDMNLTGPANLIASYTKDNKIEFEDLFAFALNWKRAAANGGILPKIAPVSQQTNKTFWIKR